MNEFKLGLQIGILGGGQLAQMLALSAHKMGYVPVIASESSKDPATKVVQRWHACNFKDPLQIQDFLQKVDVATFESEFLDAEALALVSQKTGKKLFPDPSIMASIQDRLPQKELYFKYKLATSDYQPVQKASDLDQCFDDWGAFVLKTRRGGYDGYGTFIVSKPKELTALQDRLSTGDLKNLSFIAERKIQFKREVALIAACDQQGEFFCYPLVESHQRNAKCDWVKGPTAHPKLSAMIKKIKFFLQDMNYVGVMGIEMFDTGKDLLINEIAPRVHNSGHYTQLSHNWSQFDLHIKCVAGEPLPEVMSLQKGFAMANLIGEKRERAKIVLPMNENFHWYGKDQLKPGRKMGHINAASTTPARALEKALQQRRKVQL